MYWIELYYNLKHPYNFKKVNEISVEEGTTSANAKTIASSKHLKSVGSKSRPYSTASQFSKDYDIFDSKSRPSSMPSEGILFLYIILKG